MGLKELIRNGGFERGDAAFWTAVSPTTVVSAQTDEKKRGTYGGKIAVTAGVEASAVTSDYIPVSIHELYKLTVWLKSEDMDGAAIYAYWYDSDYNYVYSTLLNNIGAVIADFTLYTEIFQVYKEASYLRIHFYNTQAPPADYAWYVDSVSVQRLDIDKMATRREAMITIINETTEHTAYGEEFFTGVWKQAEYYLSCTSLTGTTPTLNVIIQAYDPSVELWKDVIVFQELDDAGAEAKTLLSGLGWKQRVKYTTADAGAKMLSSGLGGKERVKYTTASGIALNDCDFKVGVVYKR